MLTRRSEVIALFAVLKALFSEAAAASQLPVNRDESVLPSDTTNNSFMSDASSPSKSVKDIVALYDSPQVLKISHEHFFFFLYANAVIVQITEAPLYTEPID